MQTKSQINKTMEPQVIPNRLTLIQIPKAVQDENKEIKRLIKNILNDKKSTNNLNR